MTIIVFDYRYYAESMEDSKRHDDDPRAAVYKVIPAWVAPAIRADRIRRAIDLILAAAFRRDASAGREGEPEDATQI